jgi:hypothetical protein
MSQKGHQITKKNNQNWKKYLCLRFKTMAIMASYYFFIHMNVKELKPNFDFRPF